MARPPGRRAHILADNDPYAGCDRLRPADWFTRFPGAAPWKAVWNGKAGCGGTITPQLWPAGSDQHGTDLRKHGKQQASATRHQL